MGGVAGGPGMAGGRGVGAGPSRSAAGLGGVPIGAGARREDDGEHRRPAYLVEPDPDALFGSDELTAPPVIGVG
jgi:hypothetical protein